MAMAVFCAAVMNIAGYTKSTERKSFILIPLKHSLWAGGIRATSFNVLMYSAIVSSTVAAVRCTRLLQSCCCKTLMTMQWA